MTSKVRKLMVGAAITGFVAGTTAVAFGAGAPDEETSTTTKTTKAHKAKTEKHCCAGQNSCAGKGGCGDTKGKNSCKGQGGCSTKSSCKGQGPCAEKSGGTQ